MWTGIACPVQGPASHKGYTFLNMWKSHSKSENPRALYVHRRKGNRCELCLLFIGLFVLLLIGATTCKAEEEVVLLRRSVPPYGEQQIRDLANYYGLDLDTVDLDKESVTYAVSRLKATHVLAVLISQDVLSTLDYRQVQTALQRRKGTDIPTMVFGIRSSKDARDLQRWSGGAIRACAPAAKGLQPMTLRVTTEIGLGGALAGWELPATTRPTCHLQLEPSAKAEVMLALRGNSWSAPTLVRVEIGHSEVYFAPHLQLFDTSWVGKPAELPRAFSSMAPFILFFRHATGDRIWHLDGHYANLTIDDPWLAEPYGHLNYMSLLAEMEKHNFHTTIAFIPWNFDRNEPDVVALFRAQPKFFSISIHGNNHDHREFGGYDTNPLEEQIANIKQAIARMEQFRVSTGIPYDRIMIFPHEVAPEQTFRILKTYNFLATANSVNVPSDLPFPTDPVFLLRSYTLDFANFPSLFRYSTLGPIPKTDIAIQSFLGNPLLFYGHENLFQQGIGEFDGFADFVNQLAPDTRWTSLGDIARHLHLIRRREDGDFDVRMLSDEMVLKNPTHRNALFHIEREVDSSTRIRTLKIDGTSAIFERSANTVTLQMSIPGNQARNIKITYVNDMDLQHQEIRKTSIYVFFLRMVSDFRDIYLSRIPLGGVITQAYYRYSLESVELTVESLGRDILAILAIAFVGLWYMRRRRKNSLRKLPFPRA
jgi:peptidoglycan/xylan/chitin deacetylase (PgdA/CDA1 family)